jgi:phosphoribosylglycinamide formyltransferase-1
VARAGDGSQGLAAASHYTLAAMKRIVVLISGQGSNMQALVKAGRAEQWPAQVVAVVSNRPDAGGLAAAHALGVDTRVVDHRAFAGREDFDRALAGVIDAAQPDLVLLAGFMRVLSPSFVEHYQGRLLNIHPSLLPAFPGLHTHRRVIEAGCRIAGATVHFVAAEVDHGPIVAQAAVPVLPDDDAASLQRRVLAAEHVIYPRVARWFVQGRLQVQDHQVRQLDGEPQWLMFGASAAAEPRS